MKKHRNKLVGYKGDSEKLAHELGDLTYDSLALFLKQLSLKISKDRDADYSRGRKKLAKCLTDASVSINNASESINKAWEICMPYTDILEDK